MGSCNKVTGECACTKGYKGFDCSTKIDIDQIPTLKITTTDKGSIRIENEQNLFEITVPSIIEYDYEGNSDGSQIIEKNSWKSISSSQFSQTIIRNFTITSTIEKITTDKTTTFGNNEFQPESGNVLSDGRTAIVTNQIVSGSTNEVIIRVNLPHCIKCITNSDFSLPLSQFVIDSCTQEDEETNTSRKWLLPVVVVVPIVGFLGLATIIFMVYKKHVARVLGRGGEISMKSR
ncbi:hypothetical protein ACTA71_005127 [Dictyostelium dimigraforme]